MSAGVELFDNAAWEGEPGRLSVLTPFHRDDPKALIKTLDAQARAAGGGVEIVLLDDGGRQEALLLEVKAALSEIATPARLIVNPVNEGRARGRNRLVAAARGDHLLLLDADMAPDRSDFLQIYLDLAAQNAALAFGGFEVGRAPKSKATALHRRVQTLGECLSAAARQKDPLKYVYSSNLLVRRDVLAAEPFDEGYKGWGFEDVDWGFRAGARFPVLHVDNAATHLGLDPAETLLKKYEQSVANFSRLLERHPDAVRRFPLHRWATRLRAAPAAPAPTAGLAAVDADLGATDWDTGLRS